MKLTFNGAAREVTGSCYLLEAAGEKILIDCGMFQGEKELTSLNYKEFNFDPKKISYLILTHAHIDHSGLIPKLAKYGFQGKIIATPPTVDLAEIMLEDAATVNQDETIHENKRRLRMGLPPRKPLFTMDDVKAALRLFYPVGYDKQFSLTKKISITFRDAGHILGSAIVEIAVNEGGESKKLVFSGDLGQGSTPLLNDPQLIENADFVIIESTYGDRVHEKPESREGLLSGAVQDTFNRGGKLMIPSFAIERTQELLFYLHRLERDGKLKENVYLDSPLAIEATRVFNDHASYFPPRVKQEFQNPFTFKRLKFLKTQEESQTMNDYPNPCVIIAGNGMCTAGRIRYHLKNHLWDARNTLLFVGFQAVGTTGRFILEGSKLVKMMGIEVAVKAEVRKIEGFSSHADSNGLIRWISGFRNKPKKVFIVHGEEPSSIAFGEKLKGLGFRAYIPRLNECVELG